jgi:diguanylate cyclase (GGDEF)-like protein
VTIDQSPVGIALLCDERGAIQNVVWNGIGLEGLAPGQALGQLIDSSDRIKLLNFLVELRGKGAAFDWEINIPYRGQDVTLRLSGIISQGCLMIIGTRSPFDALDLCDEFIKISPQQAADFRTAIKAQLQLARVQSEGDVALYNEITRLNNEMVTLQRELAKKNIELQRLYQEVQTQAITDSLTGLFNRRGFFEIGEREIERARRYRHPLAAIMFDIDHFKNINDLFGHNVGDKTLVETTARCSQKLRKVDIFGRYGGEEFALLLPETQPAEAFTLAERLRSAVSQPIAAGKAILVVTISIGVAALQDHTSNLHELLECADRALYKAKEAGRNSTCVDPG